jgi:hypothetical protein
MGLLHMLPEHRSKRPAHRRVGRFFAPRTWRWSQRLIVCGRDADGYCAEDAVVAR